MAAEDLQGVVVEVQGYLQFQEEVQFCKGKIIKKSYYRIMDYTVYRPGEQVGSVPKYDGMEHIISMADWSV